MKTLETHSLSNYLYYYRFIIYIIFSPASRIEISEKRIFFHLNPIVYIFNVSLRFKQIKIKRYFHDS